MPYCHRCHSDHDFGQPCLNADVLGTSFNLPDPALPKFDPPPLFTIRDNDSNLVGFMNPLTNQINPLGGGQPFRVELNNVYDPHNLSGKPIGQLGPDNIIRPPLTFDNMPPSTFDFPEYGPPQAGPDDFGPPDPPAF